VENRNLALLSTFAVVALAFVLTLVIVMLSLGPNFPQGLLGHAETDVPATGLTPTESVPAISPPPTVTPELSLAPTPSAIAPSPTTSSAPSPTASSAPSTDPVRPSPPLSPTVIPTAQPTTADLPAKPVGVGLSTEAMLTQIEVPVRDRLDIARRLGSYDHPVPAVVHTEPIAYQLGEKQVFWVSESSVLQHYERVAQLRYVGEHAYWWIEDVFDVSDAAIQSTAQVFEEKIYPTNRAFFGSEWSPGVDGDPRIHIFIGDVPGVGGYFHSVNEYSRQINPYSNEKEMFYININAAYPGTDYLASILAHEHQHMIHWYNDTNEETWVNEGLSELAMDLNGYDTGGVVFSFYQSPDTQLNTWGDTPNDSIAHYGSSSLFMRFFVDQFGEDVMREVVAHPDNGILGFDAVLRQLDPPQTFDGVFADWVAANYLDSLGLETGGIEYPTMTVGPMALDTEHNTYPVERHASVSQYATDYISFTGSGDLTIAFTGTTRVKIAPNDPHSGGFQWWSNRGDDSDMTLTRTFDLTEVTSPPILQFWAWYDIEKDWDFAFVEASVDGGQTWSVLPGLYTTTENRSGNSFGHAWTGVSGGGATPQWVLEQVDLSAYAGQVIDVRFEYLTDDAVSHVGFLLDDFAIESSGYMDDVEQGDGGWRAEGFARSAMLSRRWC
jgi:immune inhibitor A